MEEAEEAQQQQQRPRWRRRISRPPPQQQQQQEAVVMDEIHHHHHDINNIQIDPSSSSSSAAAAAATAIPGVSCCSTTPSDSLLLFNSRKRFAREPSSDKVNDDTPETELNGNEEFAAEESTVLSERRKALFEPLEPNINGKRPSAESLLPPPDFDSASYPKGWLIGKKRKLVNVDVVESMRRIAVQEMNRKDREIDGLNEQLEEDSKVLEHLQIQLLEEKSKRTNVERENAMLQDQINMLMDMLQENENMADDGTDDP